MVTTWPTSRRGREQGVDATGGPGWKTDAANVCVVLDGVEQKHFAKIEQPLIFSQDGKCIWPTSPASTSSTGTRAVIDGQEVISAYVAVQNLVISDDGSHKPPMSPQNCSPKSN